MDYMQNLGVPYFGSEQPGPTYYYSLLNVNVFGVVDMIAQKLHVFCYDEGYGGKGGNDVASMVMEYLKVYNLLHYDDAGKPKALPSLKIVVDNCVGQNKVSAFAIFSDFLFYIETTCDVN